MATTSNVWTVIQEWLDSVPFPPTQSKLGQAVGVERSAVSDWKSGKSRPTPTHLRQLADIMGASLGPDTYDRLVAALLVDMGYSPTVSGPTYSEAVSQARSKVAPRGHLGARRRASPKGK